MKLQNMRYFIETAKHSSISETARELYVGQSTLSAALQEIEKELGITLFERGRGGIVLTPDGEDCLQYCTEIVERTDALTERYHGGSPSNNHFSVTANHLPFATRAFNRMLEKQKIEAYNMCMRESTIVSTLEDVRTGRSELGVITLSEDQIRIFERRYKSDLVFNKISEMRKYVFLNSSHPLANRKVLTVSDLSDYPYVTYDQGDSPNSFTEEKLFYKPFRRNIHVSDRATKMAVIRNGEAFTIGVDLPNYTSDLFFRRTTVELKAVPFQEDGGMVYAGYVTKKRYTAGENGRLFLRYLFEEVQSLMDLMH